MVRVAVAVTMMNKLEMERKHEQARLYVNEVYALLARWLNVIYVHNLDIHNIRRE